MGRAIAGTYVRTYVRTYVLTYVRTYVCALVAAVQEIAHIEHTGYRMQLFSIRTYVVAPIGLADSTKKCSPAQLFRDVIFSVIHGHVEVQSKDYNLVSKMDVRLQWLKACVLISRYMVEYAKKFPSGHTKGSQPFTGRKEKAVSPLIKGSSIRALDQDCRSAKELEDGLKAIIAHYPVNAGLDKVIRARAKLFQEFGNLAILVGSTTEGTMSKYPGNKGKIREANTAVLKGKLAQFETAYRQSLSNAYACRDCEWKQPLHVSETTPNAPSKPKATTMDKTEAAAPVAASLVDTTAAASLVDTTVAASLVDTTAVEVCITESMIMDRLGITELLATVALANLEFVKDPTAHAEGTQSQEPSDTQVESQEEVPTKEEPQEASADGVGLREPPAKRLKAELHQASLISLRNDPATDSKWLATIRYGLENFNVDSDILLQPEQKQPPKPESTYAHLPKFSWAKQNSVAPRHIALQALDQLCIMCKDSLDHVRIELEEKPDGGKASIVRAIAEKDFDVSKLVLPPWNSIDLDKTLISHSGGKKPKTQAKNDSSSSMKSSRLRVILAKKDDKRLRRSRGGDAEPKDKPLWTKEGFLAMSPLERVAAAKDRNKYGCISPFWAIQSTTKSSDVNIKTEAVPFNFTHMAPADGFKVPNCLKRPTYSVSIECAVNTKKIKKGDQLCVSIMRGEEDESETDDNNDGETETVDDCANAGGA